MKYLIRWAFGLAILPLCILLGSLVPIGTGSGIIIGFILGTVLSSLFLTYGTGHRYHVNGEENQQATGNNTFTVWNAAPPPWHGWQKISPR